MDCANARSEAELLSRIKELEKRIANWSDLDSLKLTNKIREMYDRGLQEGTEMVVLNTREVQMRQAFEEGLTAHLADVEELKQLQAERQALIASSETVQKAVTKLRGKQFDGAMTQLFLIGVGTWLAYETLYRQ